MKSFETSGLVKEAFCNASKFYLLSVKIVVEPGSFAAKADASSRAIDTDLYQVKVGWFASSRGLDHLFETRPRHDQPFRPSLSRLCKWYNRMAMYILV